MGTLIVALVIVVFAMILISRIARVVPQQQAWVVERLGKYAGTLNAGFHILVPFMDSVRYKHSLKEIAIDVPEQVCITKDNVQVAVDGILYFKVLDPQKASYGISDYTFAISQLAQTNLRSEIGKIDLDKTFEERTNINTAVVSEVDKASEAWGVKVLRYEIKNITPPQDVLAAMEKQMRAEREKRALTAVGRAARRGHQQRRGRQAAGHQGLGSEEAAEHQRGRGAVGGDHVGGQGHSRGDPPDRRGHRRAGRPRRHAASPGRGVHQAVRPAGQERDVDDRAGHGERRQLDDRHGHQHSQAAGGGGAEVVAKGGNVIKAAA